MGQWLGGPVTDKISNDGCNREQGLWYGVSCMQGWRDGMEDAHLTVQSLGSSCAAYLTNQEAWGWMETALFGVMDGHGGPHVARFCERYLPSEIARGPSEDVAAALINAFHQMDTMLEDPNSLDELRSMSGPSSGLKVLPQASLKSWFANPKGTGTTAVMCCVRPDEIIVANAGDSRAVLCSRGQAIDMSEDHKPNLPKERDRITRAGGAVGVQRIGPITQYRVNGGLNLSRSIGDLQYKQNFNLPAEEQMIVCTPEVRRFKRNDADEFMVICCDGVWDVLSSQEAIDFIRERLGNRGDLERRLESGALRLSGILEEMLDHCLSPDLRLTSGLGGDNMTAVLVVFGSRISASQAGRAPNGLGLPREPNRSLEHIDPYMPSHSWLCGAADC
mmetsp:Transcript_83104/g.130724  ORF Transcript_83104/g.130724 Transcript_83104/m.130724 type:complete len:390 (+) Transcript_83104:102-1271(+)